MTTPNQPNDERQQTNGVTERVAPSPIPPRPIQRPESEPPNGGPAGANPQAGNGAAAQSRENDDKQGEFGSDGADTAPKDGGNAADQTARMNGSGQAPQGDSGAPSGNGGGQSRYQDGWSALPQREPQSNLPRPGHSPVTGRQAPSGGGGLGGGLGGGVGNARTTADLAAKAARKEAAMVKSVGLDGPTRSISRPELTKDMPDLSEIRHPLPPETPAAPKPVPTPVSPAVPIAVAQAVAGEPLRATVQIRRIDPWSTLKITLVISVALFFVWMLAVGLLYIVLEGMGVWERLNDTFTEMVSQDSGASSGLIDAGTVFGYAGVIGLINVVLFTALATVGTFIYNQCCDLVGGIQVTLADPD
ncbi:DUF3566 domain-containing protein [Nocardia cyriacigeorgica]|uniref:Transmembrane domain of uncharacterized function (DUF3566) n=1 Tax=Nocardia cyriacigeorgica TaxID=135487 RepID=A0A4V6ICQ8_9NOCA|nr:DUF3566 domain-containing protein [Nocardia cyriacigeorgica]VFB00544.1 Transmembrane domain of uncharacterised function (DUF3566) [Nocardia cyriacigeorgica]